MPGIYHMISLIVFVFGLMAGSFLNAVIHRLHSGQPIVSDRSRCVYCGHQLNALDLVPLLSFIVLGGKCRYCRKKISWQYPVVELATASAFVLAAINYGLQITDHRFWIDLIFICTFIVIAVYDFKHYLILDKVVFPMLVLSLAVNIYSGSLMTGILGAISLSGFFLLQYGISKGRWIGLGDVKLGLLLGSVLGFNLGILNLVLSYFSGAIVGTILIIFGKKRLKSHMPFGTFLAFSAIITMLYGRIILDWYLKLIGF